MTSKSDRRRNEQRASSRATGERSDGQIAVSCWCERSVSFVDTQALRDGTVDDDGLVCRNVNYCWPDTPWRWDSGIGRGYRGAYTLRNGRQPEPPNPSRTARD